jgi:hypothetical protein
MISIHTLSFLKKYRFCFIFVELSKDSIQRLYRKFENRSLTLSKIERFRTGMNEMQLLVMVLYGMSYVISLFFWTPLGHRPSSSTGQNFYPVPALGDFLPVGAPYI